MKLPITNEQRRRIEYQARITEQGRMIRALRDVLLARGYSSRAIQDTVTDVLDVRAAAHTKGDSHG